MLDQLEKTMEVARRVKLYLVLGGMTASALALALAKCTYEVMEALDRGGNQFLDRLFENQILGVLSVGGIGLGLMAAYLKHSGEPKHSELPVYFAVGGIAISGLFWFMPQLAHFMATTILAPPLEVLSEFLSGAATKWMKIVLRVLFGVYLVSFVVDILFEKYVARRDVMGALEAMARKYWKELLEVGHDLFQISMIIPRLFLRRNKSHDD